MLLSAKFATIRVSNGRPNSICRAAAAPHHLLLDQNCICCLETRHYRAFKSRRCPVVPAYVHTATKLGVLLQVSRRLLVGLRKGDAVHTGWDGLKRVSCLLAKPPRQVCFDGLQTHAADCNASGRPVYSPSTSLAIAQAAGRTAAQLSCIAHE
jgi:hypothetical protein